MKKIPTIATALGVLAMMTLSAKAADILSNGNFNSGDLTGWWTYMPESPTTQNITVQPADGFSFDSTPYAYSWNHGASADGILGQSVDLSAGSQYSVSLEYRANNWGGGGVSIWYYDSSWTQIGYEWAGAYTGNGTDTGWQAFTTPTWTAPANTAHAALRLDSWSWSDTYFDNVSLNVVPEPGTLALLSGGLVILMAQRRRARQ
jgi:hypothetical protein